MRQQRFDEAIALLNSWKGRKDQSDWLAYAQYNLGVALVRKGLVTEADPFLTSVGSLESGRRELRSLRTARTSRSAMPTCRTTSPSSRSQCSSACVSTGRSPIRHCSASAGPTRRRASSRRRSRRGWSCAIATCSTPPCRKPTSPIPYAFAEAQRQRAGRRELREGDRVVRQRDGEHRQLDHRDQRRHDARQAAEARRARSLRLVLAAARAARTRRSRGTSITCWPATISRKASRTTATSRSSAERSPSGRTAWSHSRTCSTRASAHTRSACRRPTRC
jgi:hypothetical protein